MSTPVLSYESTSIKYKFLKRSGETNVLFVGILKAVILKKTHIFRMAYNE